MPTPEDDLLAASRGDDDAVRSLLLQHLPQLRAYLRRNAGGRVLAHESLSDLVQSVCREALQRADDGRLEARSDGEFVAWLYRAAMLKILNRQRHWAAGRRDAIERRAEGDDVTPADDAPSPSDGAERAEELERFAAALAQLPPDEQALVLLAYVEGLTHEQLGEQFGISAAHSRTKLSRALAKLARLAARGEPPSGAPG